MSEQKSQRIDWYWEEVEIFENIETRKLKYFVLKVRQLEKHEFIIAKMKGKPSVTKRSVHPKSSYNNVYHRVYSNR